jgi:hypothetical protein
MYKYFCLTLYINVDAITIQLFVITTWGYSAYICVVHYHIIFVFIPVNLFVMYGVCNLVLTLLHHLHIIITIPSTFVAKLFILFRC